MKLSKFSGLILVFAISLGVANQSFAWGYAGHRIIVEIAMKVLKDKGLLNNPEAAAKIQLIYNTDQNGKPLGSHVTPDQEASHSDDERSNPLYKCVACLHFANIDLNVNTYEASTKNPNGDVIVAVKILALYIATGNEDVLNQVPALAEFIKNIPMTKHEAFDQQEHYFGDTAQPFHFGSQADFGGNDVMVKVFGRVMSLHALFDAILNLFSQASQGRSIEETVGDLLRDVTTDEKNQFMTEPMEDFINRTIASRNQFYNFSSTETMPVPTKPGTPPQNPPATQQVGIIDEVYIQKYQPILLKNLVEAGFLLARLWEQELTPHRAKTPPIFPDLNLNKKSVGACQALF